MTVAMFYAGYGFGGGWIVLIFLAVLLIRMLAGRRAGPGAGRRGPGPGPWTYGRPGPPPPPRAPTPEAEGRVAAEPTVPTGTYKIPPGWFPDPTGKFDQRYWSGTAWTEHVTKDGVPSTDAPPASLSGTT